MKIIVDNTLRIIDGVNNKQLMQYCKQNLTIKNPEYLQNERLGFSNYKVSPNLYWYEKRGYNLILPFGCLKDIYSLHPDKNDYVLNYNKPTPLIYKSNIKLYDYQEKAKNKALNSKNGVIVMPAGSRENTNSIAINKRIKIKNIMDYTYL